MKRYNVYCVNPPSNPAGEYAIFELVTAHTVEIFLNCYGRLEGRRHNHRVETVEIPDPLPPTPREYKIGSFVWVCGVVDRKLDASEVDPEVGPMYRISIGSSKYTQIDVFEDEIKPNE